LDTAGPWATVWAMTPLNARLLASAALLAVAFAIPARADAPSTAADFRLEDLLPRPFQKTPRIDLSVVTDFTEEGKKLTPATPDKPVYYFGVDGGLDEEGQVTAGERHPPRAPFDKAMIQALAKAGYLAADAQHPPTLFVVFKWGSVNQYDAAGQDDNGNRMDDFQQKLLIERAGLVGGIEYQRAMARAMVDGPFELERLKNANPRLYAQATSDVYYVAAFAMDMQAATLGQTKLLWETHMSTASNGLTMDESMPVLLTAGESYFGKAMKGPQLVSMRLDDGKVTIGPVEVKGYVPVAK
jgi:hypothetical protein